MVTISAGQAGMRGVNPGAALLSAAEGRFGIARTKSQRQVKALR